FRGTYCRLVKFLCNSAPGKTGACNEVRAIVGVLVNLDNVAVRVRLAHRVQAHSDVRGDLLHELLPVVEDLQFRDDGLLSLIEVAAVREDTDHLLRVALTVVNERLCALRNELCGVATEKVLRIRTARPLTGARNDNSPAIAGL